MPSPKSDPTKPAKAPARSRSTTAKPRASAAKTADAATKDEGAAPVAKKAPTRRAPARKPAATPSAAPVAAVAAAPVVEAPVSDQREGEAVTGDAPAETAETTTLKKKELLSRVTDLSGTKRKEAKPILEAALRVLGEALSKGEELNLPPLGKIRVNRSKSDAGTDILTLRLRRDTEKKSGEKGGKQGLASEEEDD